jgi:trehalose 6-phosphate synthase
MRAFAQEVGLHNTVTDQPPPQATGLDAIHLGLCHMTNDPSRLLIVASNRGPVSYSHAADGSLTARRGGGGMVSGLTSGLGAVSADGGVLWLCAALSEGDRAVARQAARPPGTPPGEVPVRMLDIPAGMFAAAYNGIANSVLWFVHHMLFDTPNQPHFDTAFRADWAAYVAYNEAFAVALAQDSAPGTRVLIQDYHLSLAPRMLRDRQPGARIAHFEHTPWAPPDYYRLLPDDVAAAILDGILGADHAGFLAERWADSFLDCCAAVLGAQVSRSGNGGQVSYRGHVTGVAAHPLGVDAGELRARGQEADVRAAAAVLSGAVAGRQVIVRIDRTELSKNIVRGLAAYRELLVTWPQWRGQVVHLVLAYPSRSGLAEYRAYTELVHELAREINAEFGTDDWEPVILDLKDDYPRSLAAYGLADVLLVNPIRDGMNLVAEEGPVLSERGCGLVLSREAGAAALIGDSALLVNPYDVTATAEALHAALSMPAAERQRRSAAITAAASVHAPQRWLGDQLAALG